MSGKTRVWTRRHMSMRRRMPASRPLAIQIDSAAPLAAVADHPDELVHPVRRRIQVLLVRPPKEVGGDPRFDHRLAEVGGVGVGRAVPGAGGPVEEGPGVGAVHPEGDPWRSLSRLHRGVPVARTRRRGAAALADGSGVRPAGAVHPASRPATATTVLTARANALLAPWSWIRAGGWGNVISRPSLGWPPSPRSPGNGRTNPAGVRASLSPVAPSAGGRS